MIPRGTPDIRWSDLLAGFAGALLPGRRDAAADLAEHGWMRDGAALACLSVRTGFDLLLQDLALPRGSEVLVSAVTIPDMLRLVEHHGLVPVPLDLDPGTLSVDAAAVSAACGPKTRAVVVAHLFGSRMPLGPILAVAEARRLLVIEDCAQAFDGSAYCGHPASDASLFSFGPIKTATALGGAFLRCKDPAQIARLRVLQAAYPVQSTRAFARRVALFAVLKVLATPLCFGVFVAVGRHLGADPDARLHRALRGFAGGDLIARLRHQPCLGLLRLLSRRTRRRDSAVIVRRSARAEQLAALLPPAIRPGCAAPQHAHWVLPIASRDPDRLIAALRAAGFDATQKASSLVCATAPAGTPHGEPTRARQMLKALVYLPSHPALNTAGIARLARIVAQMESAADDLANCDA